MRFKNPNIWKIGALILLVGFVLVALILPADGPSAIVTEVLALIFILDLVSHIALAATQPVYSGYSPRIRPRSPPAC